MRLLCTSGLSLPFRVRVSLHVRLRMHCHCYMGSLPQALALALHYIGESRGELPAEATDIVFLVDVRGSFPGSAGPLLLRLSPRNDLWLGLPQRGPEPRDGSLVQEDVAHIWGLPMGLNTHRHQNLIICKRRFHDEHMEIIGGGV